MSAVFTTVIDEVRQLVADCYHWRRIVSEVAPWDDQDAFGHTYQAALPKPDDREVTGADLEQMMPFALVDFGEDGFKSETRSVGCYRVSGRIRARVFIKVPDDVKDDEQRALRFAIEKAQLLYQTNDLTKPGLLDLINRPGRLSVESIGLADYGRIKKEDRTTKGDAVIIEFDIRFGGN